MNQPMTDDDSMNLSKYLSSAGVCSRRGAAELVAGGAVAVNGTTAQNPGQRVTRKDRVTLHGKPVAPVREYVYIMLHKPRGYVCTMEDPHAKKKAVDLTFPCRFPGRGPPPGERPFRLSSSIIAARRERCNPKAPGSENFVPLDFFPAGGYTTQVKLYHLRQVLP